MGSVPQMLGVRGKEKNRTRQAGGQTTGAVLPDMIAPEANLSVVISVCSNMPKHRVA